MQQNKLIHPKIAANILISIYKKTRTYYIIIIVTTLLMGSLNDASRILRFAVAAVVIIYTGINLIYDLKDEKYLNEKYNIIAEKVNLK